jgi:DNA-binding SARP family transcriptional activator
MAIVVSLAVLAGLWRFRPEWPTVPGSVSSPVTTDFIEQLVLVAAWLLAGLVALLLVARGLGAKRASRPRTIQRPDLGRVSEPSLLRPIPHGLLRPLLIDPPLLVVVSRRESSMQLVEQGVGSPSKSVTRADAEPDPRPLVSLLGPLTIHGGKRSRRGLRARALELIAFLALRREGAQRDEILEALWPGDDPNRSRHRLYQAVRDARQLLGDGVASERDRYWLDRDRVRVDIDELDARLSETRLIGSSERGMELLEDLLKLFRAEPLSGCDYAWAASDIRRLRGTHAELLELVSRARLETGDARAALEAAEYGLGVDALNECLWRLALEAEAELGLREAIERRYHQLQTLLADRLGLEPSKETRALYIRLLSQT